MCFIFASNNRIVTICIILLMVWICLTELVLDSIYFYKILSSYSKFLPDNPAIQDHIDAFKHCYQATQTPKTPRRNELNHIFGLTQKLLDKNHVRDIWKLHNGHFTCLCARQNVKPYVQNFHELNVCLRELNIPLLYIVAPFKICPQDPQLPSFIHDYSENNKQDFLAGLKDSDIPAMDLHKEFHDQGYNHYDEFYKTDHHWTINAAFTAFGMIVNKLNHDFNFNIPEKCTDIHSFQIFHNPRSFAGSMSYQTSYLYTGKDDADFILPLHSPQYTVIVPEDKLTLNGDFRSTVLRPLERGQCWNYGSFTGRESFLTIIINHNPIEDKKILIVKDSFSLPFQAFLSTIFRQLDIIDLRNPGTESLTNYIQRTKPDMVIFLYNADSYYSKEMYTFK